MFSFTLHCTLISCITNKFSFHSTEGFCLRLLQGLTPSACSTQDCNEQAVALLSSDHRPHKSWHPPHPHTHLPPPQPPPDPEIGLPPNIPVSPDGEEGYSTSQLRLLHSRCHPAHSELFKPPPNKTVFDRESPPPYSLTPSPGTYGCGSGPPPSPPGALRRGAGCLPGNVRVVRDSEGNAVVTRCYTMFTPSGGRRPDHQHHQHQQQPQRHHTVAAAAAAAAPVLSRDGRDRQHLGDRPHPHPSPTTNNNGFAGHYHQPPAHVHGAFTVKDTLHPSPPPPLLGRSCPLGQSAATASSPPPPSSSPSSSSSSSSPPPPAQTVSSSRSFCVGRARSDSDSGGSAGVHQGNSCEELGAPPSYELAFSQGGGGGVENSHCVVTNTPTVTTTTTTTTTTNGGPSGV